MNGEKTMGGGLAVRVSQMQDGEGAYMAALEFSTPWALTVYCSTVHSAPCLLHGDSSAAALLRTHLTWQHSLRFHSNPYSSALPLMAAPVQPPCCTTLLLVRLQMIITNGPHMALQSCLPAAAAAAAALHCL